MHKSVRSTGILSLGLVSTALALAACDDSLELGDAGAKVGSGGSAGTSAGAAGKSGSAGAGGASGGSAGAPAGGSAGAPAGGSAGAPAGGAAGAPAGGSAGAPEGGAAGAPAGGSGGAPAGGSAGASAGGSAGAPAGGSAGAAEGGSGGAPAGGAAGAPAGGSAGASAGGSAGAPAGGAAGAGGSAGIAGSAGSSAGGSGSGGASGGSGGSGGAPTCGNAVVANACAAPLFPASAQECWTKFDLPQPNTAPLAFSCFTPAVMPKHGLTAKVARLSIDQTSRIVLWRSHSLNAVQGKEHFGLANDECGGGAGACLGVADYGSVVTAEVGPGDYQLQGEISDVIQAPLYYLVEAPPPAATNTSCAAATPLTSTLQPRVVDTQSRHFTLQYTSFPGKVGIGLRSPMNTGTATVRVRETCGGAIIAEGTAPYLVSGNSGVRVATFQAATNKTYQIEVRDITVGVQLALTVAYNLP